MFCLCLIDLKFISIESWCLVVFFLIYEADAFSYDSLEHFLSLPIANFGTYIVTCDLMMTNCIEIFWILQISVFKYQEKVRRWEREIGFSNLSPLSHYEYQVYIGENEKCFNWAKFCAVTFLFFNCIGFLFELQRCGLPLLILNPRLTAVEENGEKIFSTFPSLEPLWLNRLNWNELRSIY